jgi:hypothetical protein
MDPSQLHQTQSKGFPRQDWPGDYPQNPSVKRYKNNYSPNFSNPSISHQHRSHRPRKSRYTKESLSPSTENNSSNMQQQPKHVANIHNPGQTLLHQYNHETVQFKVVHWPSSDGSTASDIGICQQTAKEDESMTSFNSDFSNSHDDSRSLHILRRQLTDSDSDSACWTQMLSRLRRGRRVHGIKTVPGPGFTSQS